jgi:hypothetical protein
MVLSLQGTVINCSKVTKTISHLQYLARLCTYVSVNSCGTNQEELFLLQKVSSRQVTVMRHLTSIKAYFNKILSQEMTSTTDISWNVVAGTIDYSTLIVNGHTFHMERFRLLYSNTFKEVLGSLVNLTKMPESDILQDMQVYDSLSNVYPRYSLASEPQNSNIMVLFNVQIQKIITRCSVDEHFQSNFYKRFNSVTKKLMCLVFICGGPPPRMTEFLDTALLVNTTDRQRSIFWHHGAMLFLQSKSKTFYQTGFRPVARYMPPLLSRLLLWYFYMLKPAFHLVFDQDAAGNVFVDSFTIQAWSTVAPVKYEYFRTALTTFLKAICDGLDVRSYRHVVQLICEERLAYIKDDINIMRILKAAIDNQFGHGAQVYIITSDV